MLISDADWDAGNAVAMSRPVHRPKYFSPVPAVDSPTGAREHAAALRTLEPWASARAGNLELIDLYDLRKLTGWSLKGRSERFQAFDLARLAIEGTEYKNLA